MGVSFFETMRGQLIDSDGGVHPVDFEIKAEATRLGRAVRDGLARVTGLIRARPWGDDAALDGTLLIAPFRQRRIVYDLRFRDAERRQYRLMGCKTLDPRRPLWSMTTMAATLRRDGGVLARGELRFDLSDLPAFAASWSLSTAIPSLDLAAPSDLETPSPPPLGGRERRLLRAYEEALIAQGLRVPAADDQTLELAQAQLAALPPAARLAYRGLLHGLDAAALLSAGRRFPALPLERRRALVRRLSEAGALGRGIALGLALPVKAAHFSRRDYLDRIGVPAFEAPPPAPPPRWMGNVHPPEGLDRETEVEADVVVVGTGAGGGPVAALLAERGLAVAVIEEGRYAGRREFSGPLEARVRRYWRGGGVTMSVGNLPLAIPTGRLVGGTTAINSGTCYATPDHVLEQWRRERGLPDDFTPGAFGPYLESVMAELGVAPAAAQWVGDIAKIVGAGAEAMGATHGPLPRNAPDCDGQGVCVFGCPTGAKRSTDVSYMPRALAANAVAFTGLPVTRILTRGRRAVAVEARGQDRSGAPRVLRVRARAVVIACGTLRSPLLLRDSGLRLPWLGRNLSVHPALGMLARSDALSEPWRAIPQSYGVEGLLDERVRFEGFWAPPQLAAAGIPFVGEALTRWMDAADHVGQYGFMVRDRNVGSVRRGPSGGPLVHYNIKPDVLERFRAGSAVLAELLLRGGAEEVFTGIGPVGTVRAVDQARAIADLKLRPADFSAMAFHPLGTCRMSPDAASGVVDFEHRIHGTENLYVVDGSAVPTSLGVNPQVTIMAMAERAATLLGQRLSDGPRVR